MKENWTYKKFGDVFNLQMGKTPSRDNLAFWGGENIWVSIADLKGKYIDSTKEHITDVAVRESGINKIPKGTAIMSFKLTIGRTAITKCDLFTNEAIMSFEPKENGVVLADYVYYYLNGCKWTGANKAVKGQTLNKKTISENTFAYPPIDTQSRIVSELDLLQSIIDKQKSQLKELDNLAQAIFYDMFGDPVENEKGWEVKKFGEVASFKNGLNFSPNENGEMYYIIGVSDFQAKSEINCNENLTIIHLNDAINKEYLLQNDDILFVRSNGNKQLIARNILVKTNNLNVTFSGFCIRARITRNDVSAFFINSLLKLPTSHEALTLKGRGCNISNLNQTTLNDYEIILPPLPLQQSFAQKVESIERQKDLINQSIREVQTLFDSRMEYYFGE